jgi:hypothetical protein
MRKLNVLYAIFVPGGIHRRLLDAIRLFASPKVRHAAHITVRGPYDDFQDPTRWSARVRGRDVTVGGIGEFFEGEQNTIYLKVRSEAVREIWEKRDYPDYSPHVTLFNEKGPEFRGYAEALRALVLRYPILFTFHAEGLEPIVLERKPLPLRVDYDPEDLAAFLPNPPSIAEVDAADEQTRLGWIEALAKALVAAGDRQAPLKSEPTRDKETAGAHT